MSKPDRANKRKKKETKAEQKTHVIQHVDQSLLLHNRRRERVITVIELTSDTGLQAAARTGEVESGHPQVANIAHGMAEILVP